jgi:hypothetical protein
MPKKPESGTKMWCPGCQTNSICAALRPFPNNPQLEEQRGKLTAISDIHWFARRRKCSACGHEFETAEIDHDLLYELVRLRDAMHAIRKTADALIQWHTNKC